MNNRKKRVLFAIPKSASFTTPVTAAFEKLDMDVYHFDYIKPDVWSRIIGFTANHSSHKLLAKCYKQWVNQKLVRSVTHISPDYLFVIKGETLTAETINLIKNHGAVTINWFPDNVGSWKLLMQTARNYDYYISVCKYLTQKLNRNGRPAFYLPVADIADEEFLQTKKIYNIVFAGHKTHKREVYFSNILDLGFDLWGYPHWRQSTLAAYYREYVSVRQMKKIFRQAKIVVNVSTAEAGIPISIANLKNFEATGVGTFVLSEYSTALAELFHEDKEMVFFRNKTELREKAQYYLKHNEKREKIAHAGWLRTKRDHTYINRLNQLFTNIHNLKK